MRKKCGFLLLIFIMGIFLTGCGKDKELAVFQTQFEDFCTKVSVLDTSINSIDVENENAKEELLGYFDQVDEQFQAFAQLDFPKQFRNLETLADEAGDYMKEAVTYFHLAYADDSYDEALDQYARENQARALKRLQIIISFLHGEKPDDVDLVLQ